MLCFLKMRSSPTFPIRGFAESRTELFSKLDFQGLRALNFTQFVGGLKNLGNVLFFKSHEILGFHVFMFWAALRISCFLKR